MQQTIDTPHARMSVLPPDLPHRTFDRIPEELRDRQQWVGFKYEQKGEKRTKVPYNAQHPAKKASTTNSSTWSTFERAARAAEHGVFDGIGYVFSADDPYTAIDFDHARNPATQQLTPDVKEIIARFDSYTEVSASGTGVHIIAKGGLPGKGVKRPAIEIYDQERFFVMTGECIHGEHSPIPERQKDVDDLYAKHALNNGRSANDPIPLIDWSADPVAAWEKASPLLADHMRQIAAGADSTAMKEYAGKSEADQALLTALFRMDRLTPDEAAAAFRATPRWTGMVHRHGERDARRRLQQNLNSAVRFQAQVSPDGAEEGSGETDGGNTGTTEAQRLLALAEGTELFTTPDGARYASFRVDGHRQTHSMGRGSRLTSWLTNQYFGRYDKPPGQRAIADVLHTLEARADFNGDVRDVSTRIAAHEGRIYVDLCDATWRAIEIDRKGWKIVDESPVHFRRPKGMLPLPVPEHGGKLNDLFAFGFANAENEDDRVKILAWLVMTFHPTGPYPILDLCGEQGSAKTTTTRFLRRLIDPAKPLTRAQPRDERELAIAMKNCRIAAFDNLSGLPPWLADAFCRIATGSGFAARQLYTDDEETLFDTRAPLLLNGIPTLAVRPDLLDRTLSVTLPRITEDRRRSEEEIEDAFRQQHPRLLGALCDAVSGALRNEASTRERTKKLPRLADFMVWVTAAEPALGWKAGTFARVYANERADAVHTALDATPLASVIRQFMDGQQHGWGTTELIKQRKETWEGTAGELLAAFKDVAEALKIRDEFWLKTSHGLSNALTRIAPAIHDAGEYAVEAGRTQHKRFIRITRLNFYGDGGSEKGDALHPHGDALHGGERPPHRGSESSENRTLVRNGDAGDALFTGSCTPTLVEEKGGREEEKEREREDVQDSPKRASPASPASPSIREAPLGEFLALWYDWYESEPVALGVLLPLARDTALLPPSLYAGHAKAEGAVRGILADIADHPPVGWEISETDDGLFSIGCPESWDYEV